MKKTTKTIADHRGFLYTEAQYREMLDQLPEAHAVTFAPDQWEEGLDTEHIHEAFEEVSDDVRWDDEFQQSKAFFMSAWNKANSVQDRLDKKGDDPAIHNRGYYHKRAGEAILYMENLGDMYSRGVVDRQWLRVKLATMYKSCQQRVNAVKWTRLKEGGVRGYIPGCEYSVTDLRAMANTALTILGEMGFRIPEEWWMTDSKGSIVGYDFSKEGRQDRTGEDWANEIRIEFYDLID